MTEQRLTKTEFDEKKRCLESLAYSSVLLAELVLVNGLTVAAAAQQLNMSRQNAHQIMKRVGALIEGFPADWEKLELWVPPELAAEVRRRVHDALERHKMQSGQDD